MKDVRYIFSFSYNINYNKYNINYNNGLFSLRNLNNLSKNTGGLIGSKTT